MLAYIAGSCKNAFLTAFLTVYTATVYTNKTEIVLCRRLGGHPAIQMQLLRHNSWVTVTGYRKPNLKGLRADRAEEGHMHVADAFDAHVVPLSSLPE